MKKIFISVLIFLVLFLPLVSAEPICEEGDVRYHTCPDGTEVFWCACENGQWTCITSPENQCGSPPIAELELLDDECYVNQACNFDGSESYDSDGYIISWGVDFGDGSIIPGAPGIGPPSEFSHTYTKSGTYEVILRVMDDDNLIGSDKLKITISGPGGEVIRVNFTRGIYAKLGEKFKLQETQPVKITNYLDENGNPLRMYLQDINEEDESVKVEVLFGKNSQIIKIPLDGSKSIFDVTIHFLSIDNRWEYATFMIIQGPKIGETGELEQIKANITKMEQRMTITRAQERIGNVTNEIGKYEVNETEKGLGYGISWFFGLVAEQEIEDAKFLREQSSQLDETAQLLLTLSEQVGEPAKAVLIEQANSLQEQALVFQQKAYEKEKNAKGIFSWLG